MIGRQRKVLHIGNLYSRKMTDITQQAMVDLLNAKGPDLMRRIELSELFFSYLVSKKVVQDIQVKDLKVSGFCCFFQLFDLAELRA